MSTSSETKLVKTAYVKLSYTPQQILELKNCMHPDTGPEYFMTHFMYVQHPTRGIIKFEPYEYQYGLIDCYHNYRYSINLVSRQLGKTTVAAGYLLWYAMFIPNSTILIAAHKYTGTQEIMERIRFIYEGVADHIRAGVVTYNKHSIKFDNGSRIVAQTTTTNTGRGMSLSLVYLDEFAFVEPRVANEFWASLSPTLSTGGKCIITSTPNNPDDRFAQLWQGAISTIDEWGEHKEVGKNGFKSYFADWKQHPERGAEWAENERQKIGDERFLREHENKFIIFSETLISAMTLDELKGIQPILRTGHIRWYKKINPACTYVVGLDPSLGTGGNYSAIQVLELPTMIQVAEWQHNKSPVEDQVRILKEICKEIYDSGATEIYWSVESNTLGEAALVVIRDTGEDNFHGTMLHDPRNDLGAKLKRKGFLTTNKVKLEACARLKHFVEQKKLTVNSENLISELRTFIRSGSSFEASQGSNDDLVMSMILVIRMAIYVSTWEDSTYNKINNSIHAYNEDDDYEPPLPIMI